MRLSIQLGLALLGVSLLLTAPAWARGVAILSYRAAESPATVDATAREVARTLRDAGLEPVRDPYAVAHAQLEAGAVRRERLGRFAAIARMADEGWRAYLAVEASFAAARLSEARRAAQEVLDLDGGIAVYAELSLRLGAVQLYLARSAEAEQLFRLASTLAPDREVTVAEFAPDVVAAFAAAGAGTAAMVEVAIGVAGAEAALVEIDGRAVGRAPLSIGVSAGQHVVVVRAPGFFSHGRVFAAMASNSREPLAVDLTLEHNPRAGAVLVGPDATAVGSGEAGATLALEGLNFYGDFAGVVLVASVWRRGRPALLGQWCAGVPTRCGRVVEIGYDKAAGLRAAARQLWEDLDRGRRFPATLLVDARLVAGDKAPRDVIVNGGNKGSRWWKWTLAGVGVSAVTAAALFLATRDNEITPVITGDPCDFGGCL